MFDVVGRPLRYTLSKSIEALMGPEGRNTARVISADRQSDDVDEHDGDDDDDDDGSHPSSSAVPTPSARAGARPRRSAAAGKRKPKELDGFRPQYAVKLRRPRDDVEAQRLYNHIRTVAFYLDAVPMFGHRLPFNIGVDSILGLIPGFGDSLGLLLGLYLVLLASLFGLPWQLLGLMVLHVALDALVGLVPVVGDALDVVFKANLRNLRLLEDHLESTKGQCGAGRFRLVFPPADRFQPKDPIVAAAAAPGATKPAQKRRW